MADLTEQHKETTLRDFLNVVFRRKGMIVSIVLLATAIVVVLNVLHPTVYESRSRVLIKRGERANVFTGGVRYLPWEEEISSQLELILSEAVFSKAAEILADSARVRGVDKLGDFRGAGVRADVIGESNVITISYTDVDPAFARLACAAVTESFREYFRERTAPPAMADYFASEIEDAKKELDFWREKKRRFLDKEMFFGAREEGRRLLYDLGNLESQSIGVESDLSAQEMNVENLRALMSLPPDELEEKLSFVIGSNYLQSGIISNIKLSIQSLKVRRAELLNKFTPRHPEVIAVDNQIADLRGQLKDEVKNLYTLELSKLIELRSKKDFLEKKIGEIRAKIDAIPEKDTELQKLENKISVLQSKYELLLKKQDDAEIALASSPEWDVTILSPASTAFAKRKDYVRMALGPFFSFIVALGLAFFFESLDHSIRNTSEAEEYLGVPVLATLSELEEK